MVPETFERAICQVIFAGAIREKKMKVGVGYCNEKDAVLSARKVAEDAIEDGDVRNPDFVFAFCGGKLDHEAFFCGLQSVVGNEVPIIGGSAIGIITNDYLSYKGCPAVVAVVESDALQHRFVAVDDLAKDERLAGKKLAEQLSTEVQFMLRDTTRMIESAKRNATALMGEIEADRRRALLGIYIDCEGRTADHSNTLTEEAYEVQKVFNQYETPLFGFYSGVEVAPLLGKSRGLDWTGVLLVFAKE